MTPDPNVKDNMTDLTGTLTTPQPSSRSDNSSSSASSQPADSQLSDNQVVAPTGEVVDLGITSQNVNQK